MATDQSTLEGARLARRYRVGRVLGTGGMGTVHEAVDEESGQTVALKILHPHLALDEETSLRFQREAKAAAALGHPHIVHVMRFVSSPGEPPFIVMERLHGASLSELLRSEKRMAAPRVAKLAVQILSALSVLHAANLVHRDIKPANIFVANATDGEFAKLLDFGVVKLLGASPDGLHTGAGILLGTMLYMAPEQAKGKPLDGRADLYALAACMYYALSGRRHIDLKDKPDPVQYVISAGVPPLHAVAPDVDERLAAIVDRALSTKKEGRYESARAMQEAIERWMGGETATIKLAAPPSSVHVTTAGDIWGLDRRQQAFLVLVFAIVVACVAFVVTRI